MAEMKVEHTADGREIVYRVYIHSEMFALMSVVELRKKIVCQFDNNLDETLYEIKEEFDK